MIWVVGEKVEGLMVGCSVCAVSVCVPRLGARERGSAPGFEGAVRGSCEISAG